MKGMYGLFHWYLHTSTDEHNEVIEWCSAQIRDDNFYITDYGHGTIRYTFFKEEQYNWFVLRWKNGD